MKTRDLKVILSLFARASSLQRKRAALTVAAIAWGTVAILMLLAFGEGLGRQMMRSRAGMGENLAVVWPGETSKVWQGLPTGRPIRPRIDAIDYLRQRMPDLDGVVGEITSWQTPLSWGRKNLNIRVVGTNSEYGVIRHHFAREGGRFFNVRDEHEKRRVIFFGNELATEVFGDVDPVGQVVDIAGSPFTVIGVLQEKLQMGNYGGPDSMHAVIPITTFAATFGREELGNIVIKVSRPELMPEGLERFADALSARYRFDPTDTEVIQVWDTAAGAKTMNKVMLGLQIFLGIIGGLTLLIGGIGVANIMFAVVKEKTREIGVQMALGARRGWITGPFVLQGVAYTLLGGLVGLVIAIVLIVLLDLVPVEGNRALEFLGKPTLSWQIAAVTALVLGSIGILAWYFPARRAASIDPAETLRYE
jgi:putative ABC transport system permease protein